MELKSDLSDMSISSIRASIAKLRVTLRAWDAQDNTMGEPLFQEIIEEQPVKIYVEGVDATTLAARVKPKIKDKVKAKIDSYQTENDKINNVTPAFQSAITEIDGELAIKGK